jgi:hypothetical protein
MKKKPFSKSYHQSRAKCSAFNGKDRTSQLNVGAVGEQQNMCGLALNLHTFPAAPN